MDNTAKSGHAVSINNRNEGYLKGIIDVISFDTQEIVLESDCGGIQIKGENLHVKRLNLEKGELDIEGRVDSFSYVKSKVKKKGQVMNRLFR